MTSTPFWAVDGCALAGDGVIANRRMSLRPDVRFMRGPGVPVHQVRGMTKQVAHGIPERIANVSMRKVMPICTHHMSSGPRIASLPLGTPVRGKRSSHLFTEMVNRPADDLDGQRSAIADDAVYDFPGRSWPVVDMRQDATWKTDPESAMPGRNTTKSGLSAINPGLRMLHCSRSSQTAGKIH